MWECRFRQIRDSIRRFHATSAAHLLNLRADGQRSVIASAGSAGVGPIARPERFRKRHSFLGCSAGSRGLRLCLCHWLGGRSLLLRGAAAAGLGVLVGLVHWLRIVLLGAGVVHLTFCCDFYYYKSKRRLSLSIKNQ